MQSFTCIVNLILMLIWVYRIFPWHIDAWTETEMEIICHDRCQLRFDLSKHNHGK